MCVPVTTTVLFHRPVLSYPYRRPLSFSAFAASPAVSPLLTRLLSFSPTSRHPSPCLQQPYKPWSSAGASSFTRAMYPDVSEGRNFASVCVNHSYLSRSLLPSFSLPRLFYPYHCLPFSTLFRHPLPLHVSVLVRFQEYVHATSTSRRARVQHAYTRVILRIYIHRDMQTRTGENSVCRDVGRLREISRMIVPDQSKDNRNSVRAAVFCPYV